MPETSASQAENASTAQNKSDERVFRPSGLWRWAYGALGLTVCILTVRYIAQHPQFAGFVLGLPVLCFGALVAFRAPRVRTGFSASEVHVVGLFRSRRIARDRILSVDNAGGKPVIRWSTRRGRERVTTLPGLRSSARAARYLQALSAWAARE